MKLINTVKDLQEEIKKHQGVQTGLVPTMGALHNGHLSLIKKCVSENDFNIVSVFVNPVQFGPNEDYDKYPRTLEADAKLCEAQNVDVLFAPAPFDMYCDIKETTLVCPPYDAVNKLCGKTRPGHFDGVATVVTKLFNLTKCKNAYFGEKDAQQLFIIKKLVSDLNFDLNIVPCPIVREDDGLALSSRNSYLTQDQRKEALKINKALQTVKDLYQKGIKDKKTLCDAALSVMDTLEVEYFEIVSLADFEEIDIINTKALVLIAAKIPPSHVRLIDNIKL